MHNSPRETVRNYSCTKFTRDGTEPATDPVMVEHSFDLIVNDTFISTIVTTSNFHRELAVGHLITEGAIGNVSDILTIEERDGVVNLQIPSLSQGNHRHEISSSGGMGINWERPDSAIFVPLGQIFNGEVLLDSLRHLYDQTQDRTGGAHTASLVAADGTLLHKAIDVGRHNAVDKVVGMAVLNGDDLSRMFLISSGRQPGGMVMKAARAGIPLILSKAAPISSGIDSARRTNVTLCCFSTREKTKIFSAPERVVRG